MVFRITAAGATQIRWLTRPAIPRCEACPAAAIVGLCEQAPPMARGPCES